MTVTEVIGYGSLERHDNRYSSAQPVLLNGGEGIERLDPQEAQRIYAAYAGDRVDPETLEKLSQIKFPEVVEIDE